MAAIFLFLYTTGRSDENRKLANTHRHYRQLCSRRRRRNAGRSNQAKIQNALA